MVEFAGYNYNVPNFITIGNLIIDTSKANIFPNGRADEAGEMARLYLDTLPRPSYVVKDMDGRDVIIPEKTGIDLASATKDEIINYISSVRGEARKILCEIVLKNKFNHLGKYNINPQENTLKKLGVYK